MFKRTRWMVVGYGLGATTSYLAARRLRRTAQRLRAERGREPGRRDGRRHRPSRAERRRAGARRDARPRGPAPHDAPHRLGYRHAPPHPRDLSVGMPNPEPAPNRRRAAPVVVRLLRRARPHDRAVGERHPDRPHRVVHGRGHGAVQAVLRRRGDAAEQAGGVDPEVHARRWQAQRPRRRRPHQPALHVLRDDGQLQLRRLLQGRGDPVGVGAGHRGVGLDPDRLWVTVHETDDEAAEIWRDVVGLPPERIQRLGDETNLWSMADTGPCGYNSEIFFDVNPGARPGRWSRGRRGPLRRAVEPRLHAERRAGRRHRRAVAEPVHRHRRRNRAVPRGPAGRRDGVGDRADAPAHRGGRAGHGRDLRRVSRAPSATCRCASSPSTRARSRCSSATVSCRRTRSAATCCAGSSGVPCATPTCSASPISSRRRWSMRRSRRSAPRTRRSRPTASSSSTRWAARRPAFAPRSSAGSSCSTRSSNAATSRAKTASVCTTRSGSRSTSRARSRASAAGPSISTGFDARMQEQRAAGAGRAQGSGRCRGRADRALPRAARRARADRVHRPAGVHVGRGCSASSSRASARTAPEPGATVDVVLDRTPFYAESGGQVGDTGTITVPATGATRGARHAVRLPGTLVVHRQARSPTGA